MLTRLNPLDWLFLAVLLYSVLRAAVRGFVRECLALLGLIAGFLLACWYYEPAALKLHHWLSSITGLRSLAAAQFAAFLLILISIMLLAAVLASLLHRTASAIGLGFLNRGAGALFGLLRGAVLCGAFLLAVTAFLPSSPWVRASLFAPYLLRATHAVSFVMPRELAARLAQGHDRLKHTVPGWIKSPLSSHTT